MRALAMRPCPLLLPTITTRSAYALSLRHICRLEDNDLVNNGTDYSGVDALAASLATNGRLRVLGCAAALWGLCLGFSSTLCVPTIHAATLHRHCLLLVLRRRQPFPRPLSVPQLPHPHVESPRFLIYASRMNGNKLGLRGAAGLTQGLAACKSLVELR